MIYDNIKSHKKAGLHPLSRKCYFRKTTGGVLNDSSGLGAGLMILIRELNLPAFTYLGLTESNAGPSQEFQNTAQYLSFSFPV